MQTAGAVAQGGCNEIHGNVFTVGDVVDKVEQMRREMLKGVVVAHVYKSVRRQYEVVVVVTR
jgi:hypothetical protein